MTVFVDGELRMIKRFRFARVDGRWLVAWSRSTLIEGGIVKLVVENTVERFGVSEAKIGRNRGIALDDRFGLLCRIAGWLGPAPLHAASVQQIPDCTDEENEVALAASAEVVALALLATAIQACAASAGTLCGSVLAAAIVAAGATAYLSHVTSELAACYEGLAALQPPPDPIGRERTSGHSSPDCYWLHWDVSYDGGVTWQNFYSELVCNNTEL